jgi:CRP/FNR family transcriptional regulator
MIDPAILDRLALFRGLDPEAKRVLAAGATLRTLAPGTVLWRAGGRPRGLFVVLEGEVRVTRGSGGRQHVVHTEQVGGTLGDVALFHGQDYPATAIATRRSTFIVIHRDVIADAIRADPRLAMALLERLAARVRHLVDRLDRLAAFTVPARLAAWLLQRHERSRGPFTLGATQVELAEELGTVREMVVRALRQLRDAGLLQSAGRGRYIVKDADGLRALAASEPAITPPAARGPARPAPPALPAPRTRSRSP